MLKKIIVALIAATSFNVIAANAVLENLYVKAGVNETTGTLGSGGNTSPGLLYDSTGTGTFNTSYDYLTPGSPFEGFTVKQDGTSYMNNNFTFSTILKLKFSTNSIDSISSKIKSSIFKLHSSIFFYFF